MVDWSEYNDKLTSLGDKVGRNLKALFGSRNERMVRTFEPLVLKINQLEPWAQGLEAQDFKQHTERWKAAVQAKESTLDELLPEAFALCREASVRTLGLRHYDVQLVGGMVLHGGAIAEMMTGEGKTLAATLALYLNALSGMPCYLVTVNDYLAKRDCEWMGPIYDYLGLSHGAIQSNMDARLRLPIYRGDIVYGTNSEFGFDYLRDNMKTRTEDQVQSHLNFAIIDEVDSILVDEARTPLIISGPADILPDKYAEADRVALLLERDKHFEVKEKERTVSLLEDGIDEAERLLGIDSFYVEGNTDWPHYIENALRAHSLYEIDKEYVVDQGEVVIVDEFTGRKMAGRRWSDGLHQAVEQKQGIAIKAENQTLATITYQNYFRLYAKIGGMTGTAITEAGEFLKIYNLDVVTIPTNLPLVRQDHVDTVYRTEGEKWKAIVEEIETVSATGQPILVGTTSVENSEKLSGMLKAAKLKHAVLNAKNHANEAAIVAMAGAKGSVTVSTNMAGRGTDIKLGGNFEFLLRNALSEAGLVEGDLEHLEEIDKVRDNIRTQCDAQEAEVLELGGLYVLGTERHESRRIDNQLRGRSGRQGNSGASRFFLSLQDPLMRRFYKEWITNAMKRLGMEEGVPIESGMVSRAIQKAQKKVEDYHFEVRKSLLDYDEVMDKQRKTIYKVRQEVLEKAGLREKVLAMLENSLRRAARTFREDSEGFVHWFQRSFAVELEPAVAEQATRLEGADHMPALEVFVQHYDAREAELGEETQRQIDQHILLRTIDAKWMDHLRAIDALRHGIGLRGYAQKDPKNEYKTEGSQLFEKLFVAIEEEITGIILRVQLRADAGEGEGFRGAPESHLARQAAPRPKVNQAQIQQAQAMLRAREQALEADPSARMQAPPAANHLAGQAAARGQGSQRVPASSAFDAAARDRARQAAKAPEASQAVQEATLPDGQARVGRNDACPCGSGKKYKKCHGKV